VTPCPDAVRVRGAPPQPFAVGRRTRRHEPRIPRRRRGRELPGGGCGVGRGDERGPRDGRAGADTPRGRGWTEDFIREQDAGARVPPVNISVDPEGLSRHPESRRRHRVRRGRWCVSTSASTSTATSPTPRSRWTTRGPLSWVEAAEMALEAAVDEAGPGVEVGVVGQAIEDVIRGYGYTPVLNLSGHGVSARRRARGRRSRTAASIGRSNWSPDRRLRSSRSPPTAAGRSGDRGGFFRATGVGERPRPRARDRPSTDRGVRRPSPFAARWLEGDRVEMALRRLKQANAVKGYPVLREADDALVSQAEHTLLVTDDGVGSRPPASTTSTADGPDLRAVADRVGRARRGPHRGLSVLRPSCRREDARDARVVARSERNYVLLNNAPYNPGHAMVIPANTARDPTDLDDATLLDHAKLKAATLAAMRRDVDPTESTPGRTSAPRRPAARSTTSTPTWSRGGTATRTSCR